MNKKKKNEPQPPANNEEKKSADVEVKEPGEKSPEVSQMAAEPMWREEDREFGADIVNDDFSLSNGTHVDQDQMFVKTWTVKNTGKLVWLEGTKVVYHGRKNNPMVTKEEFALKTPIKPGDNVEVSVVVRVPAAPGHYSCNWRLMTPEGKVFGQKLSFSTVFHGEYVQ